MTAPARVIPEVDPSRITRHCLNGQHNRCPGRVTVFGTSGRQHFEPCACAVKGCNHGPRIRRRK